MNQTETQAAYDFAFERLQREPLDAVLELRHRADDPEQNKAVLYRLTDRWLNPESRDNLEAIDVVLEDFAGLHDEGPKVFKHAAWTGQVDVAAHLFGQYGNSVQGWSGTVWGSLPTESADMLLDKISGSAQEAPWHALIVDQLLTQPGIDPAVRGAHSLERAAVAGNVTLVGHLFPRFGDSIKEWAPGTMDRLPIASRCFVEALSDKQALVQTIPEAMAPVVEKPRARRL
jgi:hypothetical protein